MKHRALNGLASQFPQIDAAYTEIKSRYYWLPSSHHQTAAGKQAVQRAAYLFPSNTTGPSSPEDDDDDQSSNLTSTISAGPGLPTCPPMLNDSPTQITLNYLVCNRPVLELPARTTLLRNSYTITPERIPALDKLFSGIRTNCSFQREYLTHLDASAQQVRMQSRKMYKVAGTNLIETLPTWTLLTF